jgi:hypothetical protein
MIKSYKRQQKALLLASLISLSIHGGIVLILTGINQGNKLHLAKKIAPIKIELVEIKTKKTTNTTHNTQAKSKSLNTKGSISTYPSTETYYCEENRIPKTKRGRDQ